MGAWELAAWALGINSLGQPFDISQHQQHASEDNLSEYNLMHINKLKLHS